MTQSNATSPADKRPSRPPRPTPRPAPGAQVHLEGQQEVGRVVESDDYLDTLQLRGVPISGQVLVSWDREKGELRTWERVSTLVTIPT